MKMKQYSVYRAGSTYFTTVLATCITKAAENFIGTLNEPAKYELDSKEQASIRYIENYNVIGDFVIVKNR